jgi:hypothetical protein
MCEGYFGFVFLYHLCLLMNFIGFPLNMPYYLWRRFYKMAKRYKRQQLDSSLFHHGLIKILLVHQLKLQHDDWNAFLARNGFIDSNPVEVDKPMIEETIVPSSTQACLTSTLSKPTFDPKDVEQSHPNASVKNTNRPVGKPSKGDIDLGFKNKRESRLISRKLRNKSSSHVSSTIQIHESSDSKIDRFLAKEDPPSFQEEPHQAYNFMDNLPPCLKHSLGFPGISFDNKSKGNSKDSPAHNHGYSQAAITGLQCETCLFWIDKYYTDVPILQSHIKTLTDLVDPLTKENRRLKSIVHR